VDEEDRDERLEDSAARLPRLRNCGSANVQTTRIGSGVRGRWRRRFAVERIREPEQEVREEDEQRDDEAVDCALGQAASFGIRLRSSRKPSEPNAIAAHLVGRSRRRHQKRRVTTPSATYATT
jgi:hypothetical protein